MSEAMKLAVPVLALAFSAAAYFTGYLPESLAGQAIVALAAILPAPLAARVLIPLAPRGAARLALAASAFATVGIAAVPLINALRPGAPVHSVAFDEANKAETWAGAPAGYYSLLVGGQLIAREGEVTAPYRLKIGERSIDGELWKRTEQVRVGKSGSTTSEQQHNFERHSVKIEGGDTAISLARSASEISGPLRLSFFSVWLPRPVFFGLAALILLVAAYFEAKHANEKNKATLTTAIAFTFFFAFMLPDQITSAQIVKPAAGSVIASLLVGLGIAGLVSWLARRVVHGKPAPVEE